MPSIGKTALTSSVSRAMICVDGYNGFEISGRIVSPFQPEETPFRSVTDLVSRMNQLLDSFSFPQQTFSPRSFVSGDTARHNSLRNEVTRYMDEKEFMERSGSKATFIVQVQFRQNATWQGTVQWLEKKQTEKFRSTLELIKLMDGAMGDEASDGEQPAGKWA